jgi:serine/threonine protein kinase
MSPSLGFVRDSKLDTEFRDGLTIHTFVEPSGRYRRICRTEHWTLERRCLGRGGFGQVQLERCIVGDRIDELRAVKTINKQSGSVKKTTMDFQRELEAIVKFSQRRVSNTSQRWPYSLTAWLQYNSWFVESFGWYEDRDSIFITMEYCHHGDLHRYLLERRCLIVTEAQHLMYQILEGLHQMHENDFVHRDLKPAVSTTLHMLCLVIH